jgi:hypothetical protein
MWLGCWYIRNALRNLRPVQNTGSLYREFPHKRVKSRKLLSIILTGSTLSYLPQVLSGVTPREALCLGYYSTGGTLRVGYLPLNNALGTGSPPLHKIWMTCENSNFSSCTRRNWCQPVGTEFGSWFQYLNLGRTIWP